MTETRRELLVVSPYFVPGQRMMKQLEGIRQRGVRVLTNPLAFNDAPAAHVGYARYREALLRLHAKVLVKDDRLLVVGSMNKIIGPLAPDGML